MQNLNLDKLPTPPGVAVTLLELFSTPEVSLDEVNKAISADPVLTARIIKYANSPMFARRYEAQTLKQAITMLGVNGVKFIALSFSLSGIKSEQLSEAFNFDTFWSSSLATAVCAQKVHGALTGDGDTGFLVGLLMHVGQLALYCDDPAKYVDFMQGRCVFDCQLLNDEQATFGYNRYILGSQVLAAWHFPESTVRTLQELGEDKTGHRDIRALKLASRMSYLILSDDPDYGIVRSVIGEIAELLNYSDEQSDALFASAVREYGEVGTVLSYDNPELKSLKEIELEAKTRMIELSMDLHLTSSKVAAENDELKDLVYVDPLTKLGNRRQYETISAAELNRCIRSKKSFGLIVADIDHFKKINDTFGHAIGDAILTSVARKLESGVRSYDFVFRFGGEEFVVILPESNPGVCASVAERLRLTIERQSFLIGNQDIPITISLGVAAFEPSGAADIEHLFNCADEALYTAKKNGRNRYAVYELHDKSVPIAPPVVQPTGAACMASQPV